MKKNLGRQITHRGIESSESIYFPPVSRIEDTTNKTGWGSKDKIWTWEDLIEFIFPKNASPKYNQMAVKFMTFLADNIEFNTDSQKIIGITGEQISEFVKQNGYSSSTFYAYILRKLHNCGLIERRREERKRRSDSGSWCGKMVLTLSEQFLLHLNRISEWNKRLLETSKEHAKKKMASDLARMEVEPNPTESNLDEE